MSKIVENGGVRERKKEKVRDSGKSLQNLGPAQHQVAIGKLGAKSDDRKVEEPDEQDITGIVQQLAVQKAGRAKDHVVPMAIDHKINLKVLKNSRQRLMKKSLRNNLTDIFTRTFLTRKSSRILDIFESHKIALFPNRF